jgi:phage terminase large subunit-like protein
MSKQKKVEVYPSLGEVVVDWIETFLVHGPGDIQGQPIELDDEFAEFIYRCYEIYPKGHPEEGRRVYRRAALSRPKGRAKSELAAMLVCAEALGPVRFGGWDEETGDPIGEPVVSPIIKCYATMEDQASNTYETVEFMLRNGTVFDEYGLDDIGITRTNLPEGGVIEAETSKAQSKDGGKETFCVFDETHLWVLPNMKKLHATVTRNLMKRLAADGWSLETTTMYAPGEDSVAEETAKTANSLKSVLFDHKQAPLDTDITDDDSLRRALRYVYGPSAAWMDIEGLIAQFHDPQWRESDMRRYYLNQPSTLEEKFTTPNAWDALEDPTRNPEPGARVVLAFDGSLNNDSTALIYVTLEDKPHVGVVGVWERPENAPADWVVDVLDVMEAIRQAVRKYTVVELTADPARWTFQLQTIQDEGSVVSHFPQNSGFRMTAATSGFSDLIATGGMTQDGDPRLRRHVLNAILKNDNRGKRIEKDRKHSANKIDLAVAVLMGLARAGALMTVEEEEYAHLYLPSDFIKAQQQQRPAQPRSNVPTHVQPLGLDADGEPEPVGWLNQQRALQQRLALEKENA